MVDNELIAVGPALRKEDGDVEGPGGAVLVGRITGRRTRWRVARANHEEGVAEARLCYVERPSRSVAESWLVVGAPGAEVVCGVFVLAQSDKSRRQRSSGVSFDTILD